MEAESEGETEAVDPYEVDTEEDEPANDQHQDADPLDQDDAEWVRNTNNFPRIPRLTGQPGIKVPLPDDPSPLDIYKLFITDELINNWKVSCSI